MQRTRGPSKLFTSLEMEKILINKHVLRVTEKSITYTTDFKLAAVQSYIQGQKPTEIFLFAGFDLEIIGHKTPKQALFRWRKLYEQHGEQALAEDGRGRGSIGRPSTRELTIEERLKRAEARIKLLEAENDLIKKLDALEKNKCEKLSTSERF